MKRNLLTSIGAVALLLVAGAAQAVTVEIQFDTFEGMANSGVSANASQEALSGWRDVTNLGFRADNGTAGDNNVRSDQAGNGSAKGMRVRSSTGAATLDNAMQLSTLGATEVTMGFDINLDDNSTYNLIVTYSEDAAFTAPVTLATYSSFGTDNGGFFSDSITIVDGVSGIVFSDDAYFMIRNPGTGGANSTFHTFDNILITAEVPANAVPEPATATLALVGLGGLVMRRRRNLVA